MSPSSTDEKKTRTWGSGTRGHSPGSHYVTRPSVASVSNRREEETPTDAGTKQGGHKPDIIIVVKRDSMVLQFSHPDYDTPGGGAVGRSILGFFAQEHSADIIRSFENVFGSGESQSFVCRGNPPLAVGAWYHCQVTPNHGESGVESATVFARDITEWKHIEDELRAEIDELKLSIAGLSSEDEKPTEPLADQEQREEELNRFRAIMNLAGEAIFITDAHTGRFVDVNETACHWLGFSREKLLQMGVDDLDLEFPLESSDGVFDHVVDTRDAHRHKALVRGSHRRRDGTLFPVEVALTQRRFGDRDYLLVVARDVKKRTSSEQTLLDDENERRGLFAISRDAGYCSARDGKVTEVNDSALDLFGYTRGEFLGLEARKLYRNPEHIRTFQRAVEKDGSVKDYGSEFLTKAGHPFRGFLGATMRFDSHGNVQGYQCFVSLDSQDASHAAKAKLAAAEAKERADALAREADRAKSDLEKARAEAAKARVDAEHRMTEAAKAKLDTREAKKRATRAEVEAEAAQSELEKAKLEVANAKLDAEQARSETAKAKEPLKQLTREAESTMAGTQKAIYEAANLWADQARTEREATETTSATWAPESEPIVRHIRSGVRVHMKRRNTGDMHSTGGGAPAVLGAPAVRRRRSRKPSLRPGRRMKPAVWIAVAAIAVAASAGGLLALSRVDGHSGNRSAITIDSVETGVGEGRSTDDSITQVAPGSDGVADSPVESEGDSVTT